MGFSSKTGISLASGFKYQAQSPLDLRRAVDTITERDELVTLHAAWEGMHVYVKDDKKTYEYRGGTTWIPVLAGSMYTHPTYTARAAGLYKITVDGTGHISGATAVTKADITGLGIPGSDTKYGVFKAATANAAGGTGLVPAPAKGAQGLFLRGDNVWAKPTDTTYNDVTTSEHGLMTAADKTKLDGIATGANKYTHPATHSIDMITETTDKKVMTAAERTKLAGIAEKANNYTHPNYTARTSGLYKVTVDDTGHISAVAAVTKADITGLGIPSSDTWRGIQNNLTSTATDQSLSAAQGKWLNENKAAMTTLTNENLDKVTTPGFYNASGGNSVTNKPSGVDNFGMIVVHSASGDYYTQIVYAADKSYRRVCSNGTWGNWSQDIFTDTKYNDVTTSTHGLMTAADKTKLDGIATGANKYTHPTSSGNKHIPSGGSSGKVLRWSADGTAVWGDVPSDAISITRAEYNKLLTNKTYDPNKYYYVTDDFDSATIINDSASSTSTAYSSSKTNALLGTKVNKSSKVSATMNASSWSGSSAPYTITLSINGVTTSNNVEILIPGSATNAQVEAWMAAGIVNGTQAANSVTLKAYGDKPSINIPIEAIIRND